MNSTAMSRSTADILSTVSYDQAPLLKYEISCADWINDLASVFNRSIIATILV